MHNMSSLKCSKQSGLTNAWSFVAHRALALGILMVSFFYPGRITFDQNEFGNSFYERVPTGRARQGMVIGILPGNFINLTPIEAIEM